MKSMNVTRFQANHEETDTLAEHQEVRKEKAVEPLPL
jgi:hypothetical protein